MKKHQRRGHAGTLTAEGVDNGGDVMFPLTPPSATTSTRRKKLRRMFVPPTVTKIVPLPPPMTKRARMNMILMPLHQRKDIRDIRRVRRQRRRRIRRPGIIGRRGINLDRQRREAEEDDDDSDIEILDVIWVDEKNSSGVA